MCYNFHDIGGRGGWGGEQVCVPGWSQPFSSTQYYDHNCNDGGRPGEPYDDTASSSPQDLRPGSGGGGGGGFVSANERGGSGGAGGASINLYATQDIIINGSIKVNGNDGNPADDVYS